MPVPYIAVTNPDFATDPISGPRQQITIQEAIGIALSNSEVVRNLGLVDAHSDVDIIRGRLTVYDPRAAWAAAAGEWGIFDPLWTTEIQWERIDIPPGTSFSGIGTRPPELDTADFYTSIEQLLPLGTRFRTDYVTDYLFNPDHPPTLDPNPQYFSYVQFGLNQPLMQGLGVNVTMAPIRIAAAEAERTDWRFKQEVLALVRSVETAYWTLYAEQQNLRALDEALPLFREIVRVREEQARGEAGTETEVARATSEMLLYEQRRLDTLSRIAEQQLVLRNLMGLPTSDGRYFALVALPMTMPPFETVGDAIMTAVNMRPDVLRQRIAVYVAQQERVLARDTFRPKFDFNAFWRINGLGEDLGESLDVIGQNDFHDWQLGLRFQVPLGRRQGRANVRAAELIIQKERALLEQRAHQASFEVADAYRRIIWLHQQYRVSSQRVVALKQWREGAQAQFETPPPGVSTVLALELYLNNLRDFAEASIKSNAILADFNSALARLEEVKGTLLETRLVEVAGDDTAEMPEELPTPNIQLPDWMAPPPGEIEGPIPAAEPGTSTQVMPPIAAAPVAPGPALVNPEASAPVAPPIAVKDPPGSTAASPLATEPAPAAARPKDNVLSEPSEVRQPDSLLVAPQQVIPAPTKPRQPTEARADRNMADVSSRANAAPQIQTPARTRRPLPENSTPQRDPAYAKLFDQAPALPWNTSDAANTPMTDGPESKMEAPQPQAITSVPVPDPKPLRNPEEVVVEDTPQTPETARAPLPTRMRGAFESFMSTVRPEPQSPAPKAPTELPAPTKSSPPPIATQPTAPVAQQPNEVRPLLEQVELYSLRLEHAKSKSIDLTQPQRSASERSDAWRMAQRPAPQLPAAPLVNPEEVYISDLPASTGTATELRIADSRGDFTPSEPAHIPSAPPVRQPSRLVESHTAERPQNAARSAMIDPEAERGGWPRNFAANQQSSNAGTLINPAADDSREVFFVSDLENKDRPQGRTSPGLVNPEALRPMRLAPPRTQRGSTTRLAYPTSIGAVGKKSGPQAGTTQRPPQLVNPAEYVATDMATSLAPSN